MDIRCFSLLAPDEDDAYFSLSEATANDLSVDFLAARLSGDREEQRRLEQLLRRLPVRQSTIAYRQAVYRDLKAFPEVCDKLHTIFEQMQFYAHDSGGKTYEKSTIWELISRLRTLQNYVSSISQMQTLFKDKAFSSVGMQTLAAYIQRIYAESGFAELAKDVELLGADVDCIRSMTLGVNFDSEFHPCEVGILSLNPYSFGEKGLLERFFRFHKQENTDDPLLTPFTMLTHSATHDASDSPLMNNLTHIVEQMLPAVTRKLQKALKKYTDVSGIALSNRADELTFYIRFLALEKRLTAAGLPCCMAGFSADDTRLTDFYNVKLAMCYLDKTVETPIVCNDIAFTRERNVLILTGPNRGGKTIFTQGLGLAFLLFAHGVFAPCSSGQIRLCDGIYTHFPADENQTVVRGRLGEEAERFGAICKTATADSLVLCNESFATTSHTESLYIAQDALKYLCCLGARTCFNTHMHELAEDTEQLQVAQAVCGAASVIMGNRDGKDAFRIRYEKPNGKSYAHDIAFQYGITLEQLLAERSSGDTTNRQTSCKA